MRWWGVGCAAGGGDRVFVVAACGCVGAWWVAHCRGLSVFDVVCVQSFFRLFLCVFLPRWGALGCSLRACVCGSLLCPAFCAVFLCSSNVPTSPSPNASVNVCMRQPDIRLNVALRGLTSSSTNTSSMTYYVFGQWL